MYLKLFAEFWQPKVTLLEMMKIGMIREREMFDVDNFWHRPDIVIIIYVYALSEHGGVWQSTTDDEIDTW